MHFCEGSHVEKSLSVAILYVLGYSDTSNKSYQEYYIFITRNWSSNHSGAAIKKTENLTLLDNTMPGYDKYARVCCIKHSITARRWEGDGFDAWP